MLLHNHQHRLQGKGARAGEGNASTDVKQTPLTFVRHNRICQRRLPLGHDSQRRLPQNHRVAESWLLRVCRLRGCRGLLKHRLLQTLKRCCISSCLLMPQNHLG